MPIQPRPQLCPINKIIHAMRDKGHARRLMAILLLHERALEALPAGCATVLPATKIVTTLVLFMQLFLQDFGYQPAVSVPSYWLSRSIV